jgi:Carboxymuconolactone decarboxylase family
MPRIALAESVREDLGELFATATNGRRPPLNLHTQMVTAPVVLSAYVGIRRAIEAHGTVDLRTRFSLMLAVSATTGCEYTQPVDRVLTSRAGMPPDQVDAVVAGAPTADPALDALLALAREAARNAGRVTDAAWGAATDAGVTSVIRIIIASTRRTPIASVSDVGWATAARGARTPAAVA